MPPAVAAIILAAGFSSRMGEFKPLLPLAGSSALERAIGLFRNAGIEDVRVVTGHRAAALEPLLRHWGVSSLFNPGFAQGMFSSVTTGLASLEAEIDACFVLPVDLPLVRSTTVRCLLQAFSACPASVIYPVFRGERGHPPLIAGELARSLPGWTGNGGLKGALQQWEAQAREISVTDELILHDMDHPEDFQHLQQRAGWQDIPSRDECLVLLEERYQSDDPIMRHSLVVADLAVQFGTALNQTGLTLDLNLLRAAGLLHDLARREPQHEQAGAEQLRALGFSKVADLVACHMDLPISDGSEISAAEVLYLADKMVQEDRSVSLEERFQAVRERFADNLEISAKIAGRLNTAQLIQARLEKQLGSTLGGMIQQL